MEQIVNAKMEAMTNKKSADDDLEVDLLMARFENVIERRPLLLNRYGVTVSSTNQGPIREIFYLHSSVLLRQNPHNVAEWHKRVQLYETQPNMVK